MSEALEVRLRWNRPQTEFMTASERFVLFEGAIRAGKTTPLVWRVIQDAQQHPGMLILLSRWTQENLDAVIRPVFYQACPSPLLAEWLPREQLQRFRNGSGVYLRALRPSEESSRYAKVHGLTVAKVAIDQAEELPRDIYHALKGRISQPGYPQQVLLTANPPNEDHWLADEFPDAGGKPDHRLIRTSVYDNREVLGETYLASLEREYPPGTSLHRRYVLGLRGLAAQGEPVYGPSLFRRAIHVVPTLTYDPVLPLLEAWDFGHRHPAVLWSQITPEGSWHLLGECQGTDIYLEDFIPQVLAQRAQWFGPSPSVLACCDPAGVQRPQGHRYHAVRILEEHGITPRWLPGSNHPLQRSFAIQQTARLMGRLRHGRPALQVHPRCRILADGFEAGYVYDDRIRYRASAPNVRIPKKDGYYEHLQNTAEYTVLNFLAARPLPRGADQPDVDPADPPPVVPVRGRGGY